MRKILIIDDEENFCFFMKKNLEEAGDFELTVCLESTKGLDTAKWLKPELILLDIMMPGISGIDLAMKLRNDKITQNIPRVFLSALIKEDEMEKYKQLVGDSHIVSKPVKTEKLISIINSVITEQKTVSAKTKDTIRTVTFLSRQQIDFLDSLGKDSLFYHGSKLSRSKILSEMIQFLMNLGINIKEIDLKNNPFSKAISKIINKKEKAS